MIVTKLYNSKYKCDDINRHLLFLNCCCSYDKFYLNNYEKPHFSYLIIIS